MTIKKRKAPALIIILVCSFLIVSQVQAAVLVPNITRDLSVGVTGADVKSLQQFLNNNGYTIAPSGVGSKGKETNMFGYATKNALIKFQAANGITASGYLGEKTRAILKTLTIKNNPVIVSPVISTPSTSVVATTNPLTAENESLKKDNASLQTLISSLQAQIASLNAKQTELEAYIKSLKTTTNDGTGPDISSIVITNDGDDDYVDVGDSIKITFDEAINPTTIDSNLKAGSYVNSVTYSEVAGVSISSSGKVTIRNIASFDLGSVEDSGNFTSRAALSSSGKVLTITLTGGSDLEITSEDFSSAAQLNGIIEDLSGNIMTSAAGVCTPTGSFGGDSEDVSSSDGEGPVISAINISDGGKDGYIDNGDTIKITFDKAIDPDSISSSLENGTYISNVFPAEVGGVSVTSAGKILIKGINIFDMGSVRNSGDFVSKVALSSSGKILTITITGGSVEITNESFSGGTQVSGSIKDLEGDKMNNVSSVSPSGTFGGAND